MKASGLFHAIATDTVHRNQRHQPRPHHGCSSTSKSWAVININLVKTYGETRANYSSTPKNQTSSFPGVTENFTSAGDCSAPQQPALQLYHSFSRLLSDTTVRCYELGANYDLSPKGRIFIARLVLTENQGKKPNLGNLLKIFPNTTYIENWTHFPRYL